MTTATLKRRLFKTPMRDLIRGRVTGRLDIDVLLDASGLPKDAADKVRRVVKRTRLKRLEKVDVASELIAHFQDGLEAETPLEELLKSFGNEKQTAKLIRRAKKRQRPLAWHIFAWARLTVVCFLGFYIVSALYLLTGSPSVKTDYVAVINKQANQIPEDQAAWPLYRQALLNLNLKEEREWDTPIPYFAELPEPEREDIDPSYYEPPYVMDQMTRLFYSLHPNDPGWDQTVQFLREHAQSISLIREATDKTGFGLKIGFASDYSSEDLEACNYHPEPETLAAMTDKTFRDPERALIGIAIPHLSRIRDIARLLCADALRAAEAGDADTAIRDVIAIQRLSKQAEEQPLLFNGLVGISARTLGFETIQDILINYPDLLTQQQLRDLAHVLASTQIDHEPWYNGERFWFYDFLQRTYTDDGEGGGYITKKGIEDLKSYDSGDSPFNRYDGPFTGALITASLPAAAILIAPREEMRCVYDDFIDQAILDSNKPLWEYDYKDGLHAKYDQLMSSSGNRLRYLPLDVFMPALSAVNKTIHRYYGSRDGILIGIALTLYQQEHGNWPDSLDDLSPTYLPSVPIDRLTGKPLHYRITDEGPLVYSVGVDGDDDAGRVPVDTDGKVNNGMASPTQLNGPLSDRLADPNCDGDWVLWPQPHKQ